MTDRAPCEICNLPGAKLGRAGEDLNYYFECNACGDYRVSHQWRKTNLRTSMDPIVRVRLCGVVREQNDLHGQFREPITTHNYEDIASRHRQPSTPLAQVDRFLELAAEGAGAFGGIYSVTPIAKLARRLYFSTVEEFERFAGALRSMDFIEVSGVTHNQFDCTLTLKGWERAEELRKTAVVGSQAFVAMWFHKQMDSAYSTGIRPGLRRCGYNPYRVSDDPGEGKIDDKIVANIRKSRLMVADLTGLRPSVMYEAGFAHGLGIPLILTCEESAKAKYIQFAPDGSAPEEREALSWFEHVKDHAFDIRNHVILGWSTPEELAEVVENRVKRLGLDLPVVTSKV
jgi:hypothetical protein